jgi:hypothetical protein
MVLLRTMRLRRPARLGRRRVPAADSSAREPAPRGLGPGAVGGCGGLDPDVLHPIVRRLLTAPYIHEWSSSTPIAPLAESDAKRLETACKASIVGRPPDPYQPLDVREGKVNVTDPDSRPIPVGFVFMQGYDAQLDSLPLAVRPTVLTLRGGGRARWPSWRIIVGEMDDPGPVRPYGNEAARAARLRAGWARQRRRGSALSRAVLEAVGSVPRAARRRPLNRRGLWGGERG